MTRPSFPRTPAPSGVPGSNEPPDGSTTTYHHQSSGSRSDVAGGKDVIRRADRRLRPGELEGDRLLAPATDVTVLP